MLNSEFYDDEFISEITLEKALFRVEPLFVNSLIKKHPSLILAIVLADVAIEVRNNRKSRRRFGELVLIKS